MLPSQHSICWYLESNF